LIDTNGDKMGFTLFGKKRVEEEVETDETTEETDESETESEGKAIIPMSLLQGEPEIRTIGLYGEVEEKKVAELIGGLIQLAATSEVEEPVNPENPEEGTQIVSEPIEFIISTPGGNADDMLSLYDMMRVVKDTCEIHTVGIGKVMSAGVLILAAGTKGKRRLGRNCRVMIHSVIGGNAGSFHNLENEMEEIRHIQNTYIKLLAAETKMTENQLKKMINKKVNVYLSAEEAVELGIADEVF
jgi:ATP-dependent Clp protease, protease subunit